ncbi:hypothetical protein NA56DRAFT_753304 [Hyaloscypha hepaticicola]|uniref:Uncharacterized protein n=1 Tax=Hyaloscypha hepaticicola TaxID=2082293 RepID=A0A2J6PQL8_9HELO|nr:hypothetical protein NA56DRAFT_753304 [Hyaloscypha hepaticicola]
MDSWDYEESLDLLDYMPQSNNFLEIWQFEGAAEPMVQKCILDGENLDEYLSGRLDKAHDRPITAGLRLIYSQVDSQMDCNDKTVFWSRSDFMKIMESFHLSKRFTQMLANCHCFFAESPTDGEVSGAKYSSYIFSTMFHHCPFWALAAAWNPEKNITYAILHCTSNTEQGYIPHLKRFLNKTMPQYMHPILLPVINMDLETALTLNDDEAWTSEINDIEEETRQKPNYVPKPLNPHELDLFSIIQRLNGCSVFLFLIERESEAVLLHLEQARRVILELQSMSAALRHATNGLISHIDFLVNSRKNLFIRLQNLQRRSQTPLAFAYSSIGLRDNKYNIKAKEKDA